MFQWQIGDPLFFEYKVVGILERMENGKYYYANVANTPYNQVVYDEENDNDSF